MTRPRLTRAIVTLLVADWVQREALKHGERINDAMAIGEAHVVVDVWLQNPG